MKARKWVMEYGVAIGLTVLFSLVLGHVPLFRETTIGKLRASDLVQFLGYSGALAIGWFSARRLAANPPDEWKWLAPFRGLIVPLATLLAVALAYGVGLLVCAPFFGKAMRGIYNWTFIAGIVGSAVWLIVTWLRRCAPLVAEAESRKLRKAA